LHLKALTKEKVFWAPRAVSFFLPLVPDLKGEEEEEEEEGI